MPFFPLSINSTIIVIIIIPDLFLAELPWLVCIKTLGCFHRTLTLNLNFAHRLYRNIHTHTRNFQGFKCLWPSHWASIKCNNSRQKCDGKGGGGRCNCKHNIRVKRLFIYLCLRCFAFLYFIFVCYEIRFAKKCKGSLSVKCNSSLNSALTLFLQRQIRIQLCRRLLCIVCFCIRCCCYWTLTFRALLDRWTGVCFILILRLGLDRDLPLAKFASAQCFRLSLVCLVCCRHRCPIDFSDAPPSPIQIVS